MSWCMSSLSHYDAVAKHCLNSSVDPVRSISTGIIYERKRLYKWLDDKHKDPITLNKAYSIDYIDSPLAAEYAKQIATLLGAEATPARE